MEIYRVCLRVELYERDFYCNCCFLVVVSVYSNNFIKGNFIRGKGMKIRSEFYVLKSFVFEFFKYKFVVKKKKKMIVLYCNY